MIFEIYTPFSLGKEISDTRSFSRGISKGDISAGPWGWKQSSQLERFIATENTTSLWWFFILLFPLLYIFKLSGTHLLPEKLGVADVSVGRLVKHYNLARTYLRALELGRRALNETFKDQEASQLKPCLNFPFSNSIGSMGLVVFIYTFTFMGPIKSTIHVGKYYRSSHGSLWEQISRASTSHTLADSMTWGGSDVFGRLRFQRMSKW